MELMPKSGYDPRHHRRYDVRAVSGHFLLPLEVRVLNMSLTGLAIETPILLQIGGHHIFTLRHEEDVIQLDAEVKWCHPIQSERTLPGESTPCYKVGLDFTDSLDSKARELLGFLEHNVVIDCEQSISGRLWKTGGKAVNPSSCQKFQLKKLSFSDALIETDPMPEIDGPFCMELHEGHLKLQIHGRVSHVKHAGSSAESVSELTIAFQEVSPESQRTLEEMVKHFLE